MRQYCQGVRTYIKNDEEEETLGGTRFNEPATLFFHPAHDDEQ